MSRRPKSSRHRINIHRGYSLDEVARARGVTKGTVRRWTKSGLAHDSAPRRGSRHCASRSAATFRATGITAYLEASGTLENAQAMAAHESPRTTKLYDRTGDEITLDEVERISI